MKKYFISSLTLHSLLLAIFAGYFSAPVQQKKYGNTAQEVISAFIYKDNIAKSSVTKTERVNDENMKKTQPQKTNKAIALKANKKISAQKAVDQAEKSSANQGESVAVLLALLHDAIQKKQQYPESALLMQRQGKVTVWFVLHDDGHISGLKLLQSSGTASLDMAGLKAVEEAAPFTQLSQYIKNTQEYQIDIVFELA